MSRKIILAILLFAVLVNTVNAQEAEKCAFNDDCTSGLCIKEGNDTIKLNEYFFLIKGDYRNEFQFKGDHGFVSLHWDIFTQDWGYGEDKSGNFNYEGITFPFRVVAGDIPGRINNKLIGENIFREGVCEENYEIPEFSMITGIVASAICIGAFLVIRKRN